MNIVVLVKTVKPVSAIAGGGSENGVINPLDELAVEEALRIKDEAPGTVVSVVSLGGTDAENGLRRSLALGVDEALHLVCDDLEAWDSWAIAFALAQALRRTKFQLVLCGGESADRNAGLVGPYVAEILGIPHVPRIAKIQEWNDRAIVVHRRIERGDREIIECALPALLTVEKGMNRPRLPAFQAISRARTQAIDKIGLKDLETPEARLGRSMNLTETIRLSGPKPRRGSAIQVGATHTAANRRSLMMKGGEQKASGNSRLLEGVTDQALDELERLLKEHGIDFETTNDGAARDAGRDRESGA